jgi:hypothetical protein
MRHPEAWPAGPTGQIGPRRRTWRKWRGRAVEPSVSIMARSKQRLPESRRRVSPPDRRVAAAPLRYQRLLGPIRCLRTPAEVEQAVEREVEDMAAQGRPVVGHARERLVDDFKLQYDFGGQPFAYRETDQGKEILAVGFKAMGRLFRALTLEERATMVSGFAEPW